MDALRRRGDAMEHGGGEGKPFYDKADQIGREIMSVAERLESLNLRHMKQPGFDPSTTPSMSGAPSRSQLMTPRQPPAPASQPAPSAPQAPVAPQTQPTYPPGAASTAQPMQQQGDPGCPDIVAVRVFRVVVVELKTAKGRVEHAQQAWLDAWAAAGAEVYVWRPADLDRIKEALR